jgi:hypothetical protein
MKGNKMKITLKNVRLSFPQLFKATQVNGEGKPAFSAAFLIAGDDPQVDEINDAIEQVALEKWEKKANTILSTIRGKDQACLHNGDLKAQYEGFEGNYYISARAYSKPLVIDRNKQVLAEDSGKPYGGCYVNASIELWAQDNQWGKRINATLRGVQFLRDGDAFAGSAPASEDEFEDLGDTGTDDLA